MNNLFKRIKNLYKHQIIKNFINTNFIKFVNRYRYLFIGIIAFLVLLLCCCCFLFIQLFTQIGSGTLNPIRSINDLINNNEIFNSLLKIQENTAKNVKENQYYKVINVIDGDTFIVEDQNGNKIKVRLIGVDAPEMHYRKHITPECYAIEATNKAKELLTNKWVKLLPDETQDDKDKFGRYLRYVYIPENQNIMNKNNFSKSIFFNKYMIENGYAYEFTYNKPYKYQQEFKDAQNYAIRNKLGLWNPNNCEY